ncbi:hypothetical protein V5O48_012231 [Marasmius crinis-equi]|uniref:Uncharacterized protein n=1 Tax=Marasmius crinis-equi TaxID=585013 RepID=A0ABR3F3N1_9AGAR
MPSIRETRTRPYLQDVVHSALEYGSGKAKSMPIAQIYKGMKDLEDINPPGRNAKSSQKRAVGQLVEERGLWKRNGRGTVSWTADGQKHLRAARAEAGVDSSGTPSRRQYVLIAKIIDEWSRPSSSRRRRSGPTVAQLKSENKKIIHKNEELKELLERVKADSEAQARTLKQTLEVQDHLTHQRPLTPMSDFGEEDDSAALENSISSSMVVELDSDDDDGVQDYQLATPTPAPIHAPMPIRGASSLLLTRSGSWRDVATGRVTPARTTGHATPPLAHDGDESSQMTMVGQPDPEDLVRPCPPRNLSHLPTPDHTPERLVRSSSSQSSIFTLGVKDKRIQELEEELANSKLELQNVQVRLNVQVTELQSERSSLKTQLDKLIQETGQLQQDKIQLVADKGTLAARVVALTTSETDLRLEIANLKASEAQKSAELAAADSNVIALRAETAQQAQQAQDMTAAYNSMVAQKTAADTAHEQAVQEQATRRAELEGRIETLQAQVSNAEVTFQNLQTIMNQAQEEARQREQSLAKEKLDLSEKLNEANRDLNDADDTIDVLEEDLKRERTKLEIASKTLASTEAMLKQTRESLVADQSDERPRKRPRHSC